MKMLKSATLAVTAALTLSACSTMNVPTTGAVKTTTNQVVNKPKTKDMYIGEKTRVENLGFQKSQYKHLLPTGKYERFSVNYAGDKPVIKRINGFDMVKTGYAYTGHIDSVRYGFVALVNPKNQEVTRASLRVISETGTGDFDKDTTVSDKVKAENPRRDFTMVLDKDGRVFDIEEAVNGEASYCPEENLTGCLHEQAYHMHVSPEFMYYYNQGGSFMLMSNNRPVEIYVPKELVQDFYNGLKEVSK